MSQRPRPRSAARQPPLRAAALPPSRFGLLLGSFHALELCSRYQTKPDDNHLYLWVQVASGRYAGRYECAVNYAAVEWPRRLVPVLMCEREEPAPVPELPEEGFFPGAPCSYAALALRNADFIERDRESLVESLTAHARKSLRLAVYGVTYGNGEGLHEIHLNSHELPGSTHRDHLDANGQPTRDGAVACYLPDATGALRVRWFLTKFRTQNLDVP